MADQADVMDMLALIAEGAIYPNGLNAPSVLGPAPASNSYVNTVDIAQGWPMVGSLDAALKGGRTTVTVFAVPNTTSVLPTPFNFTPQAVEAPSYSMGADGDDSGFTLWGKPRVGEYATVLIDLNRVYSYAAELGDLASTVMAILANAIAADYPGSAFDGQGVVVVGARSLTVRIGAPAMLGEVIGRQKQQFRVTVWSPNPADRTAVARPIDIALRQNLRVTFPDTSTGFITYQGSNPSDERENVQIYRRDIIVFVQWDALDLIPAYEVTAVTLNIEPAQGALQRAR